MCFLQHFGIGKLQIVSKCVHARAFNDVLPMTLQQDVNVGFAKLDGCDHVPLPLEQLSGCPKVSCFDSSNLKVLRWVMT